MDDTEHRLVRNMAKEGIPWVTIQRITGRSPDTIRSMLNPAATTVPKGAPIKFGPKDVDKVLKVAEKMLKHADGQKEISLEMISRNFQMLSFHILLIIRILLEIFMQKLNNKTKSFVAYHGKAQTKK